MYHQQSMWGVLSQVPLTQGLYNHVYAPNAVRDRRTILIQKVLSLDILHQWMGHISPNAAKYISQE